MRKSFLLLFDGDELIIDRDKLLGRNTQYITTFQGGYTARFRYMSLGADIQKHFSVKINEKEIFRVLANNLFSSFSFSDN